MSFNLNKENSFIRRDKWSPTVFRPPKFKLAAAPPKKTLVATAQPWYPSTYADKSDADTLKLPLSPPPALGLSPNTKSKPAFYPASDQSTRSLDGDTIPFSPLLTLVRSCSHTFTNDATEERVYPLEMFLSARKDASHTPYGVLRWCMQQYLEVSSLKLPVHLQLSMNEVMNPEDGVTRGALGSCLKSKARPTLVRQTRHKVMSILSRITPQKYRELLSELLELPLRQADDAELHEIVRVFFEKAIQEPEYSELYARLLQQLCTMRDNERKLEVELWDRLLCHRMRRLLIAACEEEFRRPVLLTPDEEVDRTTGKPLNKEELEMKRMRIKNRLVGNIKFIGELFKMSLIVESIIADFLRLLMWDYSMSNPQVKEDYVFEVFAMLIKTVGPFLRSSNSEMLSQYLGIAKNVEVTHPRPRVRFLMMDLGDLNEKNGWVSREFVLRDAQNFENMHSTKTLAETVQSSVISTGVTTPTEKNFPRKESSADLAPVSKTPSISMNDITHGVLNINDVFRDPTGVTGLPLASGEIVSNRSPTTKNSTNLCITRSNKINGFMHDPQITCIQDQRIDATTRSSSIHNSPTMLNPRGNKQSAFSLPTNASELDSGIFSEGVPTPLLGSTRFLHEKVKVCEVVQHLIEMFNHPEEEADVLRCFNSMSLENKVLCLTWWLRCVTTNTTLFQERKRVTDLLSGLLLSCPTFKPNNIFMVIVEWMRFDIEKGSFNDCPRMFSNIAYMILYAYSAEASRLPNLADVHRLLHPGLFNILFYELLHHHGPRHALSLARAALPAAAAAAAATTAAVPPAEALRAAVEGRLRVLPYLRAAGGGPRRARRNDPTDRDAAPFGPHDPLGQCLAFPQLTEDLELMLFRWIVYERCPQWRQEVFKLALVARSGESMVFQLIHFMKIIGVLLACTCDSVQRDNGDLVFKVEEAIGYILNHRREIVFQAAAVMELIMHFALALPGRTRPECGTKRVELLRQTFERWCIQGLVDKKAVVRAIRSLNNTDGRIQVFTSCYNSIVDDELSWDIMLGCLS